MEAQRKKERNESSAEEFIEVNAMAMKMKRWGLKASQ